MVFEFQQEKAFLELQERQFLALREFRSQKKKTKPKKSSPKEQVQEELRESATLRLQFYYRCYYYSL
jgi:hypothetical protein